MPFDHLYWLAPMAALATLLGGWLVVRFLQGRGSLMRHMSGVAAGYLMSVTLVRVLPESVEQGGEAMALWAVAGFFLIHLLEHGISPHFHYGEESHSHHGTPLTGILALLGLSLHSFMDGMSITAAQHTQSGLGLMVFTGVLLHRIPEGATISSIFLVRGFGNRKALIAAGVLALAALLGSMGQHYLNIRLGPVLGLTGGLSLYVACSDLLPEAQKEKGWKSTAGLAVGILLFMAILHLAPHQHHGS
ncbi:ZIP family metal transporter [Mesoterricola sediminis]|uniref:Divalent cation transporter n=1 Tax=Mesoterricola sediminis TaxID=2927980 RepID=A0AA48GSU6_9BACT|nr:ZIP family metal transporter [Mesoterricola sediminis]BDU76962.1 divalent cation transporter [Mesoterricola sediminis]